MYETLRDQAASSEDDDDAPRRSVLPTGYSAPVAKTFGNPVPKAPRNVPVTRCAACFILAVDIDDHVIRDHEQLGIDRYLRMAKNPPPIPTQAKPALSFRCDQCEEYFYEAALKRNHLCHT